MLFCKCENFLKKNMTSFSFFGKGKRRNGKSVASNLLPPTQVLEESFMFGGQATSIREGEER